MPADDRAGRWRALLGHQAPFALWTAYALARPFATGGAGLWCPTHAVLGWCPACGLTGEYTDLLYHGRIPGWWTIAILAAFLALTASSLHRLRKP